MELVLPETRNKVGKGKKRNGTCIICGAQTPWFCLGCHHHYCITILNKRRKMVADESGEDAALYLCFGKAKYEEGAAPSEVVGLKSCFWAKHSTSLHATAIVGALNLEESGRYDEPVDEPEDADCPMDDDEESDNHQHTHNLQQSSEEEANLEDDQSEGS